MAGRSTLATTGVRGARCWKRLVSRLRETPPIAWDVRCGAEGACDCNHNCNRWAVWCESVVRRMLADRLVLLACCSFNPLEATGTNDSAPQRYELAGPLRCLRPFASHVRGAAVGRVNKKSGPGTRHFLFKVPGWCPNRPLAAASSGRAFSGAGCQMVRPESAGSAWWVFRWFGRSRLARASGWRGGGGLSCSGGRRWIGRCGWRGRRGACTRWRGGCRRGG